MSEVKTEPVQARFVDTEAEFFDEHMRAREPGLLWFNKDDPRSKDGVQLWYYGCPCGCGASGAVRVQAEKKPETSPSWLWNGSTETPVLSPSVHHVGHWHGWLGGSSGERPGWWISA